MQLVSCKTITQSLPETSKLYVFCLKIKRHWPGRPWPRGHILMSLALASKIKSLALKSQFLENCPVLGSMTAVFFELLKFVDRMKKIFDTFF